MRRDLAIRIGLGLIVGVALAMAAIPAEGARRTSGAYDRYVDDAHVAELVLDAGDQTGALFDAVAEVPGVINAARLGPLLPVALGPPSDILLPGADFQLGVADQHFGVDVNRHVMVDGVVAKPDRLEAVVTRDWSRRFGTEVGDTVALTLLDTHKIGPVNSFKELAEKVAADLSLSTTVDLRVTGVILVATEVAPDDQDRTSALFVSPAVSGALGLPTDITFGLQYLDVSPEFDLVEVGAAVVATAARLAALDPEASAPSLTATSTDQDRAARAIAPHLVVLWILSGVGGLVGLVLTVPAVARQASADRSSDDVLDAMGLGPGGRSALAALRLVPTAAVGMLTGVMITLLGSRWFPIGPVREFEPESGMRADVPVLIAVAIAGCAVPLVGLLLPALRRRHARRRLGGGIADRLAERGGSLPVLLGVRLALPEGRRDTSMRVALLTLTFGFVAAGSVLWTAAGFDRLADEPSRQGWNWDLTLVEGFGYGEIPRQLDTVLGNADAGAWSLVHFASLETNGARYPTFGLEHRQGTIAFEVLEGRMPNGPDEIAFGALTLDRLGADVGDRVAVGGGDLSRDAEIVGRVVLPALAPTDDARPRMGEGAVMTSDGFQSRNLEKPATMALVDARPGDAVSDLEQRIAAGLPEQRTLNIMRDPQAGEIRAWNADLDRSPLLLVAATVLLSAIVLVHAVALSARKARRDLAIVRALGATTRQSAEVLHSQALLLAGTAIVVGVPLGGLIGSLVWRRVAGVLGVAGDGVWPGVPLFAMVAATVIVALAAGVRPGRNVANQQVAEALRAE